MNKEQELEKHIAIIDKQSVKNQANYLATDLSEFETPEVQKLLYVLKGEQYSRALKEGEREVLNMDYDELIKEYNLIVDKKSNKSAANRNRVVQVILRLIKEERISFNEQGYAQSYIIVNANSNK